MTGKKCVDRMAQRKCTESAIGRVCFGHYQVVACLSIVTTASSCQKTSC